MFQAAVKVILLYIIKGIVHRFKAWKRKLIVSLKRRPYNIPLVMLAICCMIYTFNLTPHSNASMYVSSRIIALYVFIITLASILVIISFMNAFSKRAKKRKWLMMAVVYVLIGLQLLLDWTYLSIMIDETRVRANPVPITPDIAASMNWTYIHLGALAVTLVAIVLLPVYHKLFLKINTAVDDDELGELLDDGENLVVEDEI